MMRLLILSLVTLSSALQAGSRVFPVPTELRSERFTMTIDGQPAAVAHAATTYHFANFELQGSATVSVTAPSADYWAKGVEIQPWRWGIRPALQGRTITFTISEPMKLSISRPGDHGAGAEMLFLFANMPDPNAPKPNTPGVRYFAPGVYHENIDAKDGDVIYLAPGAVVFGAFNIWGVKDVRISGGGTIVYDGPQDPNTDEGWKHQRNWHVIVMDDAHHIRISGITCVVRSRTWMIQMLDSRDIEFDNVKVIGGCPGNANQDGIDWLGGGDTVVRDCFFRASDDIFALYGNWLGYTEQALTTPGHDVENIRVERSVLSTSISNVVRVGWPQKIFNSRNFVMRDSDVIHMGMGGCKIPFGLLEIWSDPGGRGLHTDYSFEDIRLEDWYSLTQLRQQNPSIRNVAFEKIWAMERPPLVPSVISGDVSGVRFRDVQIAAGAGVSPAYEKGELQAAFTYSEGEIKPGKAVDLYASASMGKKYEWSFGDGTRAEGRRVQHAFADARGTLWDGSGRFRVLLKVTDEAGQTAWTSRPVVVSSNFHEANAVGDLTAGLRFRYYEGEWKGLPNFDKLTAVSAGTAPGIDVSVRTKDENYGFVYDGFLNVPESGGYTFQLASNDGGRLEIDAEAVATSPAPKAQVCGAIGNMVQLARGSIGLKAGKHAFRVSMSHAEGPDGLGVWWEGPRQLLSSIPASAFFRRAKD